MWWIFLSVLPAFCILGCADSRPVKPPDGHVPQNNPPSTNRSKEKNSKSAKRSKDTTKKSNSVPSSKSNKSNNSKPWKNSERLQNQRWYYGLCTRDMITPLLIKKGDYIVRTTQKGKKYTITLNVKNTKAVDNLQISINAKNEYVLHTLVNEKDSKTFETVMELIDYYKDNQMPNGILLVRGISRPNWLIAPRNVKYIKEDIMGCGNFSSVYRGTVKISEQIVGCAIKVLNFNDENGLTEASARKTFLAEAKIQSSLKHENVVAMSGVVLDCPPIMMVMELCCGGSLEKHLQTRGKEISLFEKQLYLLEAAQGMRYLHSQGCIHRDLAARNCLIGSNGKIKVSDFGLSLFIPDGDTVTSALATVPLRWMAPECLRREQAFSTKTDVWAFGVLVFEEFSNGSKPFADAETDSAEVRMIKAIKKADMPNLPDATPDAVVKLTKSIWQRTPSNRPNFTTIVLCLCEAVRQEKPLPSDELLIGSIPQVKVEQLPDLNWTEAKDNNKLKEEARLQEQNRRHNHKLLSSSPPRPSSP